MKLFIKKVYLEILVDSSISSPTKSIYLCYWEEYFFYVWIWFVMRAVLDDDSPDTSYRSALEHKEYNLGLIELLSVSP